MSDLSKNSPLPVTHYGKRGVQVPLSEALKNPNTVLNTTPKQYLPKSPNELPPQK